MCTAACVYGRTCTHVHSHSLEFYHCTFCGCCVWRCLHNQRVAMELTEHEREQFLNRDDDDEQLPHDMDLEEYVQRNARNFVNRKECILILIVILIVYIFFIGPMEVAAFIVSIFVKSPEPGHRDRSSQPYLRNNTV
jgi:hypothetical protein